jgi:hypothetical protein
MIPPINQKIAHNPAPTLEGSPVSLEAEGPDILVFGKDLRADPRIGDQNVKISCVRIKTNFRWADEDFALLWPFYVECWDRRFA